MLLSTASLKRWFAAGALCFGTLEGCGGSDDPEENGRGGASQGNEGGEAGAATGGTSAALGGKTGLGGSGNSPEGGVASGGYFGEGGDAPIVPEAGAAGANLGGAGGSYTEPAAGTPGSGGDSGGDSGSGGASVGGTNSGGTNTGGTSAAGGGGTTSTSPPLVLDVTVAANPAVPGGTLLYHISVGNVSTRAVDAAALVLRVPTGLQFSATVDAMPNSGSCNGNATCVPAEEARWSLGTIAAGSTRTIQVNARVLETVGDGDNIDTGLTLTATGINPVLFTHRTPVYSQPAAQLTIGTDYDPVTPGQTFTLDVDVGQIGTAAIANGALKAILPAGVSVVSVGSGGTQAGSEVTWLLGNVAVGATLRRSVVVKVGPAVIAGSILKFRAGLTHDGGLASDNTSEYSVSVSSERPALDLVVNAAGPAIPGRPTLYTATLSNTSARAIEDVVLALRVPAELSYSATLDAQPNSNSCNGNATCSAHEESAWELGTLAPGTSRTIQVNADVLSAAAGDGNLIASQWSVFATDVNNIRGLKVLPVLSAPAAELAVSTAVDPVTRGQAFTYQVDVGQVGPAPLANARVSLDVPEGLTFGTISNGGTAAGRRVTWSLGSLAVANTRQVSVAVTVGAGVAAGTIFTAKAQLTYDSGAEIDATAQHSVTVLAEVLPLTLDVVATPNPVVLGSRLLYTATIANTSERALEGISLFFRVPRGLEFRAGVDAEPNSNSCNGNTTCAEHEEASWTLGALAVGANRVVTVNPLVAASLTGGGLVQGTFQVNATALGGVINSKKVVPTKN